MLFHFIIIHFQEWNGHFLNEMSIHTILAIDKLEDLIFGSAHRLIILNLHIFESLYQPSLDVTGLCSLACSVNDALSTTHSMEVEFLRGQTEKVAVCHKPFTLGTVVIFTVVR